MKKVAVLGIAVISLLVGAYASIAFGYLIGGPQYAARFSPSEALYTVAVLRELRGGKNQKAVELLEAELDSHIVSHSTFNPRVARWLDVMGPLTREGNTVAVMKKVAEYRAEYPSEAASEVQEHINEHLKDFR